jgi:hypothetical protein
LVKLRLEAGEPARRALKTMPIDVEQGPGPQIGLHNRAVCIQRELADRGKIVEIHVAVARRFKLHLGPAQPLA